MRSVRFVEGAMVLFSRLFQQFGDESGPAGLMTGTKTGAIIAMEVFVELNEITPMGVVLEHGKTPIHGALSGGVAKKDVIQALGNFRSDLPQCLLRS
jgi:hypothetical protein